MGDKFRGLMSRGAGIVDKTFSETQPSPSLGGQEENAFEAPERAETSVTEASSPKQPRPKKRWYHNVADYIEDPRKHFKLIKDLRTDMEWTNLEEERTGESVV